MSHFMQKKVFARILLHYFTKKTTAFKAHRDFVESYGNHALLETIYRCWFRCFKNKDFGIEDKERYGAPKKFEDEQLEVLLHEYLCQMKAELVELLVHAQQFPNV